MPEAVVKQYIGGLIFGERKKWEPWFVFLKRERERDTDGACAVSFLGYKEVY